MPYRSERRVAFQVLIATIRERRNNSSRGKAALPSPAIEPGGGGRGEPRGKRGQAWQWLLQQQKNSVPRAYAQIQLCKRHSIHKCMRSACLRTWNNTCMCGYVYVYMCVCDVRKMVGIDISYMTQ